MNVMITVPSECKNLEPGNDYTTYLHKIAFRAQPILGKENFCYW